MAARARAAAATRRETRRVGRAHRVSARALPRTRAPPAQRVAALLDDDRLVVALAERELLLGERILKQSLGHAVVHRSAPHGRRGLMLFERVHVHLLQHANALRVVSFKRARSPRPLLLEPLALDGPGLVEPHTLLGLPLPLVLDARLLHARLGGVAIQLDLM